MNCYPFENKECEIFNDIRKKVSIEENKMKYLAENRDENRVCLIQVDGCLITKGIRCDYLLLNCDKKNSYFIELKGKKLLHAIEQIDRSVHILKKDISDFKINARIILRKVEPPQYKRREHRILREKIKKLNGTLQIKEKILEEKI